MQKTAQEVAEIIGGTIEGDGKTVINGASGIREARPGEVTFVANLKYQSLTEMTGATVIIVPPKMSLPKDKVGIRHDNPSLAFARLMEIIGPKPVKYSLGVHPSAVIGKDVQLGKDVSIQPCAVIEDRTIVGDNTVVGAGVFIGEDSTIGADTLIYPQVVIRERVVIGSRCIIHSGTVIGSDGFGYAALQGVHQKISQIGTVVLEDDVEVGANVTIDRARFDKTWIKRGTKIDNLVQIAHNVVIGENSIVVAQTGIAGSTTIGKNFVLAGQSGVAGHLTIGDNVIVGGKAGVTKSVPANTTVSGFPAVAHVKAQKLQALVNRLPKLYEKVAELEKKLKDSENNRTR